MLFVERSNRTERLLAGLAERLMTYGSTPLVPRSLVVQGQGMERWIAQSIARDYGVCANTEFFYPRHLIERVFCIAESTSQGASERVGKDSIAPANPGWATDQLTWWVARRIAANPDAPELAPLARSLAAPDRDWRLVQLAHEIASLFDDYITYRPDWVRRWTSEAAFARTALLSTDSREEAWQSWLFARVYEDLGPGHLADRAAAFEAMASGASNEERDHLVAALRETFPQALEVFAVSTLPPLYLSVIDALSGIIDVHLSVLSPSRHYWADVWQEVKDASSLADGGGEGLREQAAIAPAAAGSAESLLAGLGRLGSDFQHTLEQVSGYVEADSDSFEALDPPGTLLERVQMSLLELDEDSGEPVADADRSIQVHLCHGPKRELEVLKAAIRRAFEDDPTLCPEDVLVMAPQIDAWVPVIEAVFGAGAAVETGAGGESEGQAMAYRIADRGTLGRSPVAEAFVGLLSLLRGRATRSELLDWLALEPARSKLALDPDGVGRLADWAARAGVRFGFDEGHRSVLNLEADRGHTWAGGIDRGMLGHAVGFVPEIFADLSPAPLDEMAAPALLGALGELETTLAAARRDLARARPVWEWNEWMLSLLENTLDRRDDNVHEHQLVRVALQSLAAAAERAGFDSPIPFEAMQERFRFALENARPAQGFLSGGMTFCELVPLRAIPFRIIAIVGLSDSEFPRRRPAASYDLMARHPRFGDRNSRSDDRYLFLEALLSARDQLILTVPARDLRDGADLPPSVVISELLDVLDARFETGSPVPGERLRDRIVFEHPLQSFSARYFENEGRASWLALDEESFAGARARRDAVEAGGGMRRRFLEVLKNPGPVEEARDAPHLRLSELTDRLLHSTRTFARERLGLRLPRPQESVSDFDPDSLGPLDRSQLGTALLSDLRSGTPPEEATRRLLANPLLPIGEAGRVEAHALRTEVERLAEIAAARTMPESTRALPFDLALDLGPIRSDFESRGAVIDADAIRLSGVLRNVGAGGRLELAFSRLAGRSELVFWIEHLVLCALVQDGTFAAAEISVVPESVLIGRPENKRQPEPVVVFREVSAASEELARLCAWAWTADRAPLPFFPRSSRVFASQMRDGKVDQAWRDAQQMFFGGASRFTRAEREEGLEFERVWEGVEPLGSDGSTPLLFHFEELSRSFFEPLFDAREVSAR